MNPYTLKGIDWVIVWQSVCATDYACFINISCEFPLVFILTNILQVQFHIRTFPDKVMIIYCKYDIYTINQFSSHTLEDCYCFVISIIIVDAELRTHEP